MHVALNGWFWDQPSVGSGQYLRRLLQHLREIAPTLQLTLILPPRNRSPDNLPPNVNLMIEYGFKEINSFDVNRLYLRSQIMVIFFGLL